MKSIIYKWFLLIILFNCYFNESAGAEDLQNGIKSITESFFNFCPKHIKTNTEDVLKSLLLMEDMEDRDICQSIENWHLSKNGLQQKLVEDCVKYIQINDIVSAEYIYKQLGFSYLEEIVQKSMQSMCKHQYGEYVVKFLDLLDSKTETHLGYKYLFSSLVKTNELLSSVGFILAYRANEYLKTEQQSPNSTAAFKYILDNSLPMIKSFPFNKQVQIVNVYKQQLFSINVNLTPERQKVLSCLFKQPNLLNGTDVWELEPIENGINFKIKHLQTSKYLYVDTQIYSYDSDRRRVLLWGGESPVQYAEWQLIPQSADAFLLRNVHWNEYLYIPNNLDFELWGSGRRVFSWIPGDYDRTAYFVFQEVL